MGLISLITGRIKSNLKPRTRAIQRAGKRLKKSQTKLDYCDHCEVRSMGADSLKAVRAEGRKGKQEARNEFIRRGRVAKPKLTKLF